MASTSLSIQLKKLKTPQTSLFVESKDRASFLYDYKQANTIDKDTHLSIAISGLNELSLIDVTCKEFLNTLFNETSKSLDRATLSKEENSDLNKEIENFLLKIISPYFLLSSTHKLLEWLIFKFNIHIFNSTALIFSVLPYHETRYFTRLVQICEFEDDSKFYWLLDVKKSGVILVKTSLHRFLIKNLESLRYLCDNLINNYKNGYDINLSTSFLTSTIVCLLEKNDFEENLLIPVLQFVMSCLENLNSSLNISAFCILSFISKKVILTKNILKKILKKISKNADYFVHSNYNLEYIYCLSIICSNQNVKELPDDIVESLTKNNNFIKTELNCISLTKYLCKKLALKINENNLFKIQDLLSKVHPDVITIQEIIKSLIFCSNNEVYRNNSIELMKFFERKFPNQFDYCMNNMEIDELDKILDSSFYLKLNDGIFSLNLAINHSNIKIRQAAIKSLTNEDNNLTLDINFKNLYQDSLKSILIEQDPKLLSILLDIPNLKDLIDHKDLILYGIKILDNLDKQTEEVSNKKLNKIKQKLLNILLTLFYEEKEFLTLFIKYIYPSTEQNLNILKTILNSNFNEDFHFLAFLKNNMPQDFDLNNIFILSCDYLIDNQIKIDEKFQNLDSDYECVCQIIIYSKFLKQCSNFNVLNTVGLKIIHFLNYLIQKCTIKISSKKLENPLRCFKKQLRIIEKNIILKEFIVQILENVLFTMQSPQDFWNSYFEKNEEFYLNSLFQLIGDLQNTENGQCFTQLFKIFVEKCTLLFDNQYFVHMWICTNNLKLQARSLAICNHTLKGSRLNDKNTLYLFIALTSVNLNIRKLSVNLLLNIDLNSNEFINFAVKNSNEYLVSHNSISKVLFSENKYKKKLLNLISNYLVDYKNSYDFTIGLIKLISEDNNFILINNLIQISGDLLQQDVLTLKQKEILALIFLINLKYFCKEKSSIQGQSDYRDAIENFRQIIESDHIKKFVYKNLKKTAEIKSATLKITIINCLLNEFICTFNHHAKKSLINLITDGQVVSYLINSFISNKINAEPEKLKKKIESKISFIGEDTNWKKVLILLEITQSKDFITNSTNLLKCLFSLLKDCLLINDSSCEYIRYLVLLNIHKCCLDEDCDYQYFDFNILFNTIKYLRIESSKQELFSILNCITPYFKKEILQNFLFIFTYIGTNMMNYENSYTIQVVDETMDTIIPILIEENEKFKYQIIDIFIDALVDVPSYKRIHLFEKLVFHMKTDNSLWIVLTKLNISKIKFNIFDDHEFLDFIQNFCFVFNIKIQLNTLVNITNNMVRILQSSNIIGFEQLKEDEIKIFNDLINQQLNIILNSDNFILNVAQENWSNMELHFTNLCEKLIFLIQSYEKLPENEYNVSFLTKLRNSLEKIEKILPVNNFIIIFGKLLNSDLLETMNKTLKIFNAKLNLSTESQINKDGWTNILLLIEQSFKSLEIKSDSKIWIENLENLFVTNIIISQKLEDHEIYYENLVRLIEIILESLAKIEASNHLNSNLIIGGILCLSKLCCSVKTNSLPYIGHVIELIIKNMKNTSELKLTSLFTCLAKMTKQFSSYIGSFLPDLITKICYIRSKPITDKSMHEMISLTEDNIINLVPYRKLFDVYIKIYQILKVDSMGSLIYFFNFVNKSSTNLKGSNINEILVLIDNFMFKVINYRYEFSGKTSSECIEKLENYSLQVICILLSKLDEAKFKVFVKRLYEWSEEKCENHFLRLITFYNFTNQLVTKIQDLFSIIVIPIIASSCINYLSDLDCLKKNLSDQDNHFITLNILKTIAKSFLYDTKLVITSKDIAEKFSEPIIQQISNDLGTESMYEERIVEGVSKCISNFVKNFNDFYLIKDLHVKILNKTKNKNENIRYNALHVLHEFVLSINEEYTSYLPDAVPYLVELYEDDSEKIQKLLLTTFRDIESIIGEPISNYM